MIPLLGSGVPTVIINTEQAKGLREGVQVLLDGTSGVITTMLSAVDRYMETPAATSCVTRDGIDIRLRVSARDARAARRAVTSGADAIGLLRSEFLVPPDGRVPDVDFYRHEFKVLCEAAAPLAVTIRLIDIAADKLPAWLPEIDGVGGVLGLQGARLFGYEPVRSVYRAQLAAIDKLASQFDLKVLIPYLTSQDELLNWAGQIRQQLSRPIALGAMAETPAAALQIADWLEFVDFVALGCNDLMQCLFGADRDRPQLRGYLDPYAPALFRFLRQVAEAAPDRLHRVQLCGVLPQLPGVLPILLGLGFRTFSVEAASLDYLRQMIAATSIADARVLASSICAAHTSGQTRELLY
jgi:phosphoenolpyruvate-protein kinase (PTS system EI component)